MHLIYLIKSLKVLYEVTAEKSNDNYVNFSSKSHGIHEIIEAQVNHYHV